MRVITGIAKKTQLMTLKNPHLRPTTEKVKEAMFSIVQLKIKNSTVLDLFAGSGQLGIEALSRGAKSCTFVDCSFAAHKLQIANLKATNLYEKAKVVLCRGVYFLKKTKSKYDLIILDPPYKSNLLFDVLQLVQLKINSCGIIVCEHEKNLELPPNFKNIELQKQYNYGRIKLSFYKNTV